MHRYTFGFLTVVLCSTTPLRAQERPETPSRHSVVDAMNAVTPAVRRCGDGSGRNVVTVRIVFEGERGTVKTVQAHAMQGEAVRCVENAVRVARVPPFRQESFSVNYPFRL